MRSAEAEIRDLLKQAAKPKGRLKLGSLLASIAREAKGTHRVTLDSDLRPVLMTLATDQPLDTRYRDHDLSGNWAGYRECHVKPDLLLIYCKSDADTLRLARLGSHSELLG